MNSSSYFIKDKCLFGSFPSKEDIVILENHGVKHFVNLTRDDEKLIKPYETKYNKHNYPINDNNAPTNWLNFTKFLYKIINIIKNLEKDEKLYLHCKGGHGRSSIVVICILILYHNITLEIAVQMLNLFYQRRKNLKDKYREIILPQVPKQRKFLENYFKNLYFYKALKNHNTTGFSNFSLHNVKVDGLGIFPTSESAFNAYQVSDNKEYVIKQMKCKTPFLSRKLFQQMNIKKNEEKMIKDMKKIIYFKVKQHNDFKENLLNTGMRTIVFTDKNDLFWGIGSHNNGSNNLGKILTEIRNELYELL